MATSNGHNASFPNPIYQQVKDWAAKQEAIEKEIQAPAPLNDIEQAFLEWIPKLSSSPSPIQDEGKDEGKDYVSLLYLYRQAEPTGNKINFIDGMHPIPNALGNPQWTCAVELSETSAYEPSIRSFPAAGFGLDATGSCPPFAKKKDAKQYAAKCAIDWLAKRDLLPAHVRCSVVPQETLPALQNQPAKRLSEGSNGVLSPPPKRKAKGTNGTVDVNDDSLPATQRVSNLCQSVMGKDTAKQDMAEQLLPHILKMYRERTGDYASHVASLRS